MNVIGSQATAKNAVANGTALSAVVAQYEANPYEFILSLCLINNPANVMAVTQHVLTLRGYKVNKYANTIKAYTDVFDAFTYSTQYVVIEQIIAGITFKKSFTTADDLNNVLYGLPSPSYSINPAMWTAIGGKYVGDFASVVKQISKPTVL